MAFGTSQEEYLQTLNCIIRRVARNNIPKNYIKELIVLYYNGDKYSFTFTGQYVNLIKN